MHKVVIPVVLLLLLAVTLLASHSFAQFNGCPPGFCPVIGNSGPAPPSSCTGAIDLSTGCVQPMMR